MEKKQAKKRRKQQKTVSTWSPRPELIRIVDFLLNPDDRRSKAEKIKDAGLTEPVFYRWMKDERFVDYINKQIDKYTNAEVSEVWKALIRNCRMGKEQSIKLFFELKGVYKQKHEITGEGGGPIKVDATVNFYLPDNQRGDTNA